jgi:hypothetical protein
MSSNKCIMMSIASSTTDSDSSDGSEDDGCGRRRRCSNNILVNNYYMNSVTDRCITMLDKNTPFINFLINKRTSDNSRQSYSHIAAFIPESIGKRCCFIRCPKGKGRNR